MEQVWDLDKVKRSQRRSSIQISLIFWAFIIGSMIYGFHYENGAFVLLASFCVIMTAFAGGSLYTLRTGKIIGTKDKRYSESFERDRIGEKEWMGKKKIETTILIVVSLVFTVCLFVVDWSGIRMNAFHDFLPLIGAGVGTTLGQFIRSNKVE
ncbi:MULTISPECIES: hypothetical protein [Pontibacillus]|uniref:DUF2178 domain-containing protein n=1 Tax=Pontibacillus chungwhensis TaxID=265426 RepID=A0ABY8V3P3_9BACI|nr:MULTISPECIES: hypothetical protein [Pontibacillus]MCD5322169.1 hypothetical protein [Pontibacillus sp. HN14]WIF99464.1 hypothetical protein QNI29_07345 [Pontibacillus chungwhensis]